MQNHTSSYDDNNFRISKIVSLLDTPHRERNKLGTIAWLGESRQRCDRRHWIGEECWSLAFSSCCKKERKVSRRKLWERENNVTICVLETSLHKRCWGFGPKLWSKDFVKLALEHYLNKKMSRNDSKCLRGSRLEQLEQLEHQINI